MAERPSVHGHGHPPVMIVITANDFGQVGLDVAQRKQVTVKV
jgi:hypothetical protein